ncbi:hypothetical protein A3F34_02540 [Candidatus Roizmanbacteria bacterium RIFCSPHIGHO2_12_FULL_44_10]|uniref:Uncharacterized protein n=1 Tax=Candidatus Roizmanbacteria bacterium RIFCSPHIGHO2_12_FULL_44_10 TaxID=1802054 RepID=A0A1F7I861_9BACT|nr:MAG: hypothetical protein A3F34_02540 [Candidatus Roizmanbacteria bacterium RIFCSPHIGHO2_12_FULL_44_10]
MILWIGLFVGIFLTLYRFERSVKSFQSSFSAKVVSLFKEKNVELASALGITAAHFMIGKLKKKRKSGYN